MDITIDSTLVCHLDEDRISELWRRPQLVRNRMSLPPVKGIGDILPQPFQIHAVRIDQKHQIDQILNPCIGSLPARQHVGMEFLRKMFFT
ncbi:MAG: hypothetical protein RL346_385 [Verrucomicrobiota bacterium]